MAERFQRNTQQRQVILEELQKLTTHPTAAGLYATVKRRLPKISLGTVYRNLELLSSMGIIQKLDLGGGEARFDADLSRHDHVRCLRCGRVDDVFLPPLDLSGGTANDWGGYAIIGHRLEFFGICPQCRNRQDDGRDEAPGVTSTITQKPL